MPIDVQMPDGTIISGVPDNITQADLLKRYQAYAPPKVSTGAVPDELGRYDAAKQPIEGPPVVTPEGGFSGALAGSTQQIQADIMRLAGKIGLKDTAQAEREAKQYEAQARKVFKPTEKGWTEDPLTKLAETAGGSLPYMAAPIAAGVAALALPEIGIAGGLIGTAELAAGAVGVGQFTGSNLSRQVQEGKTLEEASLLKAGAAAIPQAALDVFGLKMLPGIRQIFTKAGVEVSEKALEEVAKKGLLEQAGYYTLQTGKTMGAEGLTEAGQAVFERLQAGLNIADPDARKEYFENFVGGAVLGGAFSVPGHAYEAIKNKKPEQVIEESKGDLEKGKEEEQRARLAELETISNGTPDQFVTDENGKTEKVKGQLGRFFTPEEKTEYDQLNKKFGKKSTETTQIGTVPTGGSQDAQAMADELAGKDITQQPAPEMSDEERNRAIEIHNGAMATSYVTSILEEAQKGFVIAGQEYEQTGKSPTMSKVADFLIKRFSPLMGKEQAARYTQYLIEEGGLFNLENATNNEYFGEAVNGVKPISIGTPKPAPEPAIQPEPPAVEPEETAPEEVPKFAVDDKGKKLSYPMFVDMANKGYKVYSFENERTYENKGGKKYRTLEKDGVRIALEPQQVLFTDPKYPNRQPQTGFGNEEDVAFHYIGVDPEARRQGKARAALADLIEIADKNGYTLYGEPVQLEKEGMTKEQLTNLYAQYGFKPTDETGKVIVREPGAKAETGKKEFLATELTTSKDGYIADKDGKPIVFYHTTRALDENGKQIKELIPGGPDGTGSGKAIWFGSDPNEIQAAHNAPVGYEGSYTIPAYIKMNNPLYIDEFNYEEQRAKWGPDLPFSLSDERIKKLKDAGFDGIISELVTGKIDEVVVFDKDQITFKADYKSAEAKPVEAKPEPKSFNIGKSQTEIYDEIKGLGSEQLCQWLIDNAPNSAAKHIAEKLLAKVKENNKHGVPVKIEILKGRNRDTTAYGTQQPIVIQGKTQYYAIRYNGLNAIGIEDQYTGTKYSTIMHELVHMVGSLQLFLTKRRDYKGDKSIYKDFSSIRKALEKRVEEELQKPRSNRHPAMGNIKSFMDISSFGLRDGKTHFNYGKSTFDEIMAYGFTDKDFQDFLASIKIGNKTALTKLVEIFRKLLGIDPQYETALDRLLTASDKLFAQTPADKQKILSKFGWQFGPQATPNAIPIKTTSAGFKRFFNGSKVVDQDGKPLVMYHGTAEDLFTVFDKEKIRENDYDTPFNGFWFSSDKFTSPAMRDAKNTIPVYLSIKNPAPSEVWRKVSKDVDKESNEGNLRLSKGSRSEGDEVRHRLQAMGYDGIHYSGKPSINKNEFEKNGYTSFKTLAGKSYTISINEENGGLDLYSGKVNGKPTYETEEHITGYLDLNDFLNTFEDEVWVAFEPNQIKSATSNTGEFDINNPDITKAAIPSGASGEGRNYKGQPVQASWSFPEDNIKHWYGLSDEKIDNIIYKLQDKQIDTKRAQQMIEKEVGKIDDDLNVYDKEQLYHGRTATGIREFLLNELMPAIKQLQKLGLSPQEMREYLHNRHAQERNDKMNEINKLDPVTGKERKTPWELQDRASGIATADAKAYLAGLDPKKKTALEKVADMFDKMVKETQDILVKSGAETKETIDAWNSTYEHYVPLFRVEEDVGGFGTTGASKGFGTQGKFSKRAMGSEKEVQDILGNLIAQRERALIRSEKIKVGRALYALALKNPNPDLWLPVNPDAIKNKEALIKELMDLGFSDAADIANNLMEEPKSRYISKIKKIDPNTGLPLSDTEESVKLKVDNLKRFGENVFPIRINGKDRYIFFNQGNPTAVRMVQSLKNLDADSLGDIEGVIGRMTRWFASVNTQYNPIFGAVNLLRDVQGAMFNLSTTPLAGMQGKVSSGIIPAMRGIMNVLRDERKGKTDTTGKWAKAFQDFRKQGGQTGYRESLIRTDEEEAIIEKEMGKIKEGNVKKAFGAVMGALTDFNDMMENSVRVSAYVAALDKGLSKQQAAIIAKNLTVNFDKKGQLSARINAYYAFFNASVQGTARLAQTLKGPMGRKIIAGGIGLGAMQAVMLAAAGYREDEPPEFVRERNFVIPMPDGKYLSIPYPLGLHILPNVGRITTEFVLGGGKNAGKKVANMTGAFMDAFSPVGSSGLSIQSVLPTVLDPIAALESNKDAFGRPIYREDRATNPMPGYLRSRESASEISKQISYFLNLASGGGKYSKGFLSPTADELDYIAGQLTGGVGRELIKTEQAIKAGVTGEELPTYRIPLAGRFIGDTESKAAESQRFYGNITRMADHEHEVKGRQKNKENVMEYYRDHPEARFWQMANNVENEINALNKQKKEFQEKGFPKERIQRIDNQKALKMKRFNDFIAKYEE